MKTKYFVISSTGKVMSEAYSTQESAQEYADSLMIDFADDGINFWVVDKI